jgi:hypothetical protein
MPEIRMLNLRSAKGADARRQSGKELLCPLGEALNPAPVLRGFFKTKGADARRHTGEELARPSGGALDAAPVLREFIRRIR